jgi:RNA polymerase sigma-70 factor, ECF subfamily
VRTESQDEPANPRSSDAASDFDGFFRQQFPIVARTVALVVQDFETGQDVAQESFARLYARWQGMESQAHARNFVFKVAINMARSHLRRERRQLAAQGPGRPAPVDEATRAADRVTLAGALGGLSGRQRVCLALVDYAELDVRTAAGFLRIRSSTVRVHLSRGRRALAQALESTYREESRDG